MISAEATVGIQVRAGAITWSSKKGWVRLTRIPTGDRWRVRHDVHVYRKTITDVLCVGPLRIAWGT